MRKSFYRLLLFSLILTSHIALSQHFITGWKASVNLSRRNFITENSDLDKSISKDNKRQFGFDFGVFKVIPLKEKWSLDTEVIYQLRRHKIYDSKYYFSYLSVNPSIRYNVSNSVVLFSGINIGLLLNALNTFDYYENNSGPFPEGIPERKTVNINKYYKTIDLQWSSGVEFRIKEKWSLEFRNALSLLDVNARYNLSSDSKPIIYKFWSLSASAKFYLK